MSSWVFVKIHPGNVLVPDNTKSLPGAAITRNNMESPSMWSSGIRLRTIPLDMIELSSLNCNWKLNIWNQGPIIFQRTMSGRRPFHSIISFFGTNICDLAILVRERRLRWFGHVMRSNGEINRVRSRPVPGRKGPGRPKKTWEECVKQDLKVCGLSEAGTQDRLSWRSSVKNSRQEPTPSNGSLLQSMAAPPARRVLGMRTRSFNKTGFDWLIDWLKPLSNPKLMYHR